MASKMIKGEWRCAEKERFDIIGTVLYGAMLFTLIYGLSLIPDRAGAYLLAATVAITAVFFNWELKNRNPILKIGVFRNNTVFLFSNRAALINYSATFAVTFLLSLYLQYMKGYGPETAGLILVAQPIVQAVFSPLAGRLSDRVEPRIVASAGMGLCVVGLALFAFLTPETSTTLIIASLMFLGLGFALFSSPNTNAIMSSVDRCDYGVASGMVSTMRLIGQMLSLGIAMVTFSVIMGHVEIEPRMLGGLMTSIRVAFGIFAGLCVIGVVFSLARGNLQRTAVPAIRTIGEK
jgi:MFS family permease